jgi:hypothetical protein
MVIEMASVINYKTTTKLKMNKMNKVMTLAAIVTVSAANAAVINISASDATYIRSGSNAGTNYQSSNTNVANDNGSYHRIVFYTYDFSAISGTITDVTWSLTENVGSGSDNYVVVGLSDGTIDLGSITWTSADTAGQVASNQPVGTSLASFSGAGGSASYDVTLASSFFDGDADRQVTLAIYDTDSGITGIGWTDGPTLNVTAVPEPSSAVLLGLGGLLVTLRRRR